MRTFLLSVMKSAFLREIAVFCSEIYSKWFYLYFPFVCVSMWVYGSCVKTTQRPEDGIGFSGPGVTGICEPSDVVLRTDPESSRRASNNFDQWAIHLTSPIKSSLKKKYIKYWLFALLLLFNVNLKFPFTLSSQGQFKTLSSVFYPRETLQFYSNFTHTQCYLGAIFRLVFPGVITDQNLTKLLAFLFSFVSLNYQRPEENVSHSWIVFDFLNSYKVSKTYKAPHRWR